MNGAPALETIHGHPIISATPVQPACGHRRAGRVIRVDRIAEEPVLRYVVAAQYATDGVLDREWHLGDYISDLAQAKRAFAERNI
jgi:hypothetical protein